MTVRGMYILNKDEIKGSQRNSLTAFLTYLIAICSTKSFITPYILINWVYS